MGRGLPAEAACVTATASQHPFIGRIFDAIGQVLARRRSHGGEVHSIRDSAKAAQYEVQRRRFLRRLDGQSEPVAGLASLPSITC